MENIKFRGVFEKGSEKVKPREKQSNDLMKFVYMH